MDILLTLRCCFSGNVLWIHQFSNETVTLYHRFASPPSSPSICSWFPKILTQCTVRRTPISAALPTCLALDPSLQTPVTLRRERSRCQFQTRTLQQGLFLLPLCRCENTSLQAFRFVPVRFEWKNTGIGYFFFSFVNCSVTNRANCSLQRCIVHAISVNVLFSG